MLSRRATRCARGLTLEGLPESTSLRRRVLGMRIRQRSGLSVPVSRRGRRRRPRTVTIPSRKRPRGARGRPTRPGCVGLTAPGPRHRAMAMRLGRLLGLSAVAVFVLSAFTPLLAAVAALLGGPARLEPADAIVVAARGGVDSDGVLSNASLRRTLHGIALYRRGLAPLLLFSGGHSDRRPDEAATRADLERTSLEAWEFRRPPSSPTRAPVRLARRHGQCV
jgi:hypothetical protein